MTLDALALATRTEPEDAANYPHRFEVEKAVAFPAVIARIVECLTEGNAAEEIVEALHVPRVDDWRYSEILYDEAVNIYDIPNVWEDALIPQKVFQDPLGPYADDPDRQARQLATINFLQVWFTRTLRNQMRGLLKAEYGWKTQNDLEKQAAETGQHQGIHVYWL